MTILPLNLANNASPDALRNFFRGCREAARTLGRSRLVSISLQVDALDPLAVLESIFEPSELHFYCERPSEGIVLAGAEAILSFESEGPNRFSACQQFIDTTLADAIAVGDADARFGGPHFFAAFSFFDRVGADEPFPAARIFVPRWQIARDREHTLAVANVMVSAETDLELLTEKIWRAHSKFRSFDYASPAFDESVLTPRTFMTASVGREEAFAESVEKAVAAIRAGAFRKIVLARAKDVSASDRLHPLSVLNGLRQKFPDCYAFSVANGCGQSFIGASPERLLRVSGDVLTTAALAGSAPRGRSASEDAAFASGLLRSEKDQHEHRLVLESIARRLRPLGLELTHGVRPRLLSLANVHHLQTPVEARLPKGVRLLDVLSRLHPTPAVGGTPREAACARIRELEAFERGLYAGPIGWIDHRGSGEFFVAIRSALVENNRARVFAGVGIVEGSSAEKEFAETEWKFKALFDALLS